MKEMEINQTLLKELIKKVIEVEMGNKSVPEYKFMDKSGVGLVKLDKMLKRDRMDTGNPQDEVYTTDLFTLEEGPRIGAGLMEMIKSTFDWTLTYDEIDYIIEGHLDIIIDGRTISGEKGDVILIPKHSKIQFSAPDYAKFLYVVYPANWQGEK